jgi:hypothetical protein
VSSFQKMCEVCDCAVENKTGIVIKNRIKNFKCSIVMITRTYCDECQIYCMRWKNQIIVKNKYLGKKVFRTLAVFESKEF